MVVVVIDWFPGILYNLMASMMMVMMVVGGGVNNRSCDALVES